MAGGDEPVFDAVTRTALVEEMASGRLALARRAKAVGKFFTVVGEDFLNEIAKLSSASPNTVTTTIRTYIEEGLSAVEKREFYQPTSQIDSYFDRLMVYFSENPPRTLKEAKAKIEQITGMSFSLSHVRNLLLSMGL